MRRRALAVMVTAVLLTGCIATDEPPDYKDGNLRLWTVDVDGTECVVASRGSISVAIDCDWSKS